MRKVRGRRASIIQGIVQCESEWQCSRQGAEDPSRHDSASSHEKDAFGCEKCVPSLQAGDFGEDAVTASYLKLLSTEKNKVRILLAIAHHLSLLLRQSCLQRSWTRNSV